MKTPEAAKPSVAAKAAGNDAIAINRIVEIMSVGDPVTMPPRYVASDPDVRRIALRFVADDQRSEFVDALRSIGQIGPTQLKNDLGDVPEAGEGTVLADRIIKIRAVIRWLQPIVDAYNELLLIGNSDGVLFLDQIWNEYQHFIGRKPHLASTYESLVTFYEQKVAKMTDGRARAKAEEAATAAAVAAAEAKKGEPK